MRYRTGGWCYRDGWCLNFYAEGDSDWCPLKIESITYCSFPGDELPFEKLEQYIVSDVLTCRGYGVDFDLSHKNKSYSSKSSHREGDRSWHKRIGGNSLVWR